jgi:hypothetical protein
MVKGILNFIRDFRLCRDPAVQELKHLAYGGSTFETFKDVLPRVPRGILRGNDHKESMIRAMKHAAANSDQQSMLPLARLCANTPLVIESVRDMPYGGIRNESLLAVLDMVTSAPTDQRQAVHSALQQNNFLNNVLEYCGGDQAERFRQRINNSLGDND